MAKGMFDDLGLNTSKQKDMFGDLASDSGELFGDLGLDSAKASAPPQRSKDLTAPLLEHVMSGANSLIQGGTTIVEGLLSIPSEVASVFTGSDPTKDLLFQAGTSLKKTVREHFPESENIGEIEKAILQGFGQFGAQIGMAVATGGGSTFGQIPQISQGFQTLGRALVVASGSGSMGKEGILDAKRHGADLETQKNAMLTGMGLGLTELLPIDNALDILNKTSPGFKQKFINGLIQGTTEALQESSQTIGQNIFAKLNFDDQRALTDNLAMSAGVGGVVGFGAGFLMSMLGMTPPKFRPVAPEDTKVIDDSDKKLEAAVADIDDKVPGGISKKERAILDGIAEDYFGIENAPDESFKGLDVSTVEAYVREVSNADIQKDTGTRSKKPSKGRSRRSGWRANTKYSSITNEQRDILEGIVAKLENYEQAVEKFSESETNISQRYALHIAKEKFGIEDSKGVKAKKDKKVDSKKKAEAKLAAEEMAEKDLQDTLAEDQQIQEELVTEEKKPLTGEDLLREKYLDTEETIQEIKQDLKDKKKEEPELTPDQIKENNERFTKLRGAIKPLPDDIIEEARQGLIRTRDEFNLTDEDLNVQGKIELVSTESLQISLSEGYYNIGSDLIPSVGKRVYDYLEDSYYGRDLDITDQEVIDYVLNNTLYHQTNASNEIRSEGFKFDVKKGAKAGANDSIPGVYVKTTPTYVAEKLIGKNQLPVKAAIKNPYVANNYNDFYIKFEKDFNVKPRRKNMFDVFNVNDPEVVKEISKSRKEVYETLKANGYDSVILKADYSPEMTSFTTVIVLDAKNVKVLDHKLVPDQIKLAEEQSKKEISDATKAEARKLPKITSQIESVEGLRLPQEEREIISTSLDKAREILTLVEAGKVREARKLLSNDDPLGYYSIALEEDHIQIDDAVENLAKIERALHDSVGATVKVQTGELPSVHERVPKKYLEVKSLDEAELDYDLMPRENSYKPMVYRSAVQAERVLDENPKYTELIKTGNKFYLGRVHPDLSLRGDFNIAAIGDSVESFDNYDKKFNEEDVVSERQVELIKSTSPFVKVADGIYISNTEDGRTIAIKKEGNKDWATYLGTVEQIQAGTAELINSYQSLPKAKIALEGGKKVVTKKTISYSELVNYLDKQIADHKSLKESELTDLIENQDVDILDQTDALSEAVPLDSLTLSDEFDDNYFQERDLGDTYEDLTTIFNDDRGALNPEDSGVLDAKKRILNDIKNIGRLGKQAGLEHLSDPFVKKYRKFFKGIENFAKDESGEIRWSRDNELAGLLKDFLDSIKYLYRQIKLNLRRFWYWGTSTKAAKGIKLSKGETVRWTRYLLHEIQSMTASWKTSTNEAVTAEVEYLEGKERIVPRHGKNDTNIPKAQKPLIPEDAPTQKDPNIDYKKRIIDGLRSPSHMMRAFFDHENNPVKDIFESISAFSTNQLNFLKWKRALLKNTESAEHKVMKALEPIYNKFGKLLEARRKQTKTVTDLTKKYNTIKESEAKNKISKSLNIAKTKLKRQTATLKKEMEGQISPIIFELAKKHADVRIVLNAGQELPEGITLSPEELKISDKLTEYFESVAVRLEAVGIPIIKSRTYIHKILPEAFKGKGQDKYAKRSSVPAILSFMHQNDQSRIWFPSTHMILNKYIPLVERKLAYQPFLNRWTEAIALMPPELSKYLDNWVTSNIDRKLPDSWEKTVNFVVSVEYIRLVGLSTSVAFKHLTKGADTLAMFDPVTGVKATSKAMSTVWKIAAQNAGFSIAETNDMKLQRAFINSRALVKMMDESPGMRTMAERFKMISGGLVMGTEYLDNGISIFASAIAGQAKGFTPEQVHTMIWDTVLNANFRGQADQPAAYKNTLGRVIFMFQSTPSKLLEYRVDMVRKAMKGENDIFGTPYGMRLIRYLMLIGMAEGVARALGTSLIEIMGHFPYVSHFFTPSKKNFVELHQPKPAISPVIQWGSQMAKDGIYDGTAEHFVYKGQYSKIKAMFSHPYPTKYYESPAHHMLGLKKVDAPVWGTKKKSRGRSSRSRRASRL